MLGKRGELQIGEALDMPGRLGRPRREDAGSAGDQCEDAERRRRAKIPAQLDFAERVDRATELGPSHTTMLVDHAPVRTPGRGIARRGRRCAVGRAREVGVRAKQRLADASRTRKDGRVPWRLRPNHSSKTPGPSRRKHIRRGEGAAGTDRWAPVRLVSLQSLHDAGREDARDARFGERK